MKHFKRYKQIFLTLALFSTPLTVWGTSKTTACLRAWGASPPASVSTLLQQHQTQLTTQVQRPSQRLVFTGVDERDVYNPTKPFAIQFQGHTVRVLAARVESRDVEHSEVIFFVEHEDHWKPLEDAPRMPLQDPFFTFIDGELIFGGVEISPRSDGGNDYRTVFYRSWDLDGLRNKKPFATGPWGMKDIRLVQIAKDKMGLFTRPQGIIPGTSIDAGPGRIGFKIIRSLSELTPDNILATPLIQNQFIEGEWGGVNEAQLLSDGSIVALAHVAHYDSVQHRHYYAAAFKITFEDSSNTNFNVSPFEIILRRQELLDGLQGPAKRPDLVDVIFSGGWELSDQGATIYVGAGDTETHRKMLPRPGILRWDSSTPNK
jgi:hypothetical protein